MLLVFVTTIVIVGGVPCQRFWMCQNASKLCKLLSVTV